MTPEERKAEEGKKPGEKVATMTQTRTSDVASAIVFLTWWLEGLRQALCKEKSFRAVLEYDEEAQNATFTVYEKINKDE